MQEAVVVRFILLSTMCWKADNYSVSNPGFILFVDPVDCPV